MTFTRLHWCLIFLITLLSSIVFFLFYTSLEEGKYILLACSTITGLYALFSLFKLITYRRFQIVHEEALTYKSACPNCGEPLCGHEISCPKCGGFLPKNIPLDSDETKGTIGI